jgi:hypothetical protein
MTKLLWFPKTNSSHRSTFNSRSSRNSHNSTRSSRNNQL